MTENNPTSRVRAVILTTQRTGSTFLVECLGSHPDIECASEILIGEPDSPRPQYRGRFKQLAKIGRILTSGAWRPAHRIQGFYSAGRAHVRAFKVMYNQLAHPVALRYLRDNRDIRVLHLSRQNLLKVQVSRILMGKRNRVQAISPVDAVSTHVDPQQIVAAMRSARDRYRRFEALFSGHPHLALTYESLFDGQNLDAEIARRICDFLGVAPCPMKSKLIKLNPESLRKMVTNFDELEAVVSHTEFADMLD